MTIRGPKDEVDDEPEVPAKPLPLIDSAASTTRAPSSLARPPLRLVGAPPTDSTAPVEPQSGLPVIRLGLDLHRVVAETQGILSQDPLIYQRPHELVSVARTARYSRSCPIEPGTPIIRPLTAAAMISRLSAIVRFEKAEMPSPEKVAEAAAVGDPPPKPRWKPCMAPGVVLGSTLAAEDWPAVLPLQGVTETPVLRPDGSIWQAKGYDATTGYLYLPNSEYPPVAEHPTQADARAALGELEAVFSDFPHVDRAAKMVPIAAILTILARPAVDGPVPAFCLDASTRGSGKTLQADTIAVIATGRSASRATYPRAKNGDPNDEELEKILAAYALAGSRLILLDNVASVFGGAPLDKVLTARDDVDLRILGRTEMRRLHWGAVVLASGNNFTFAQDTLRRVLRSRLESPLQNPEERTDFAIESLVPYCRQHRSRLVSSALTVLRAYTAKGRPSTGLKRWGSFEEWSALVPSAIVFAGGADVMQARPGDEVGQLGDLDSLEMLLSNWERLAREIGMAMTTKRIVNHIYPAPKADDPPDGWDDLRDALESACPCRPGSAVASKALGERFSRWCGRVMAGRRLQRATIARGATTWTVETLSRPS